MLNIENRDELDIDILEKVNGGIDEKKIDRIHVNQAVQLYKMVSARIKISNKPDKQDRLNALNEMQIRTDGNQGRFYLGNNEVSFDEYVKAVNNLLY